MPPAPGLAEAQSATSAMTALLLRIERSAAGQVRVCRSVAEIRSAMASGALATVLHIEGAEAIDPDLHALDVLHAAGLRSLGPVWSRANIFGHGVPFRFPSSPDTGPGLTDRGKALVRRCNALRILIDLSHMNEQGFWDVARLSEAPLVATHSNVHALSPTSRNLTARQLAAIRESRGVVGLNYACGFLREDGKMQADTDLELLLRHLDALLEALGEDGVALGSDFDGATIPAAIGDVTGVPRLLDAMLAHGYGPTLVRKIACDNWLSVLQRTWGA
jgi:membrane dipeptidase